MRSHVGGMGEVFSSVIAPHPNPLPEGEGTERATILIPFLTSTPRNLTGYRLAPVPKYNTVPAPSPCRRGDLTCHNFNPVSDFYAEKFNGLQVNSRT